MRHLWARIGALVLLTALVAGCSQENDEPTESSSDPVVVNVTVKDGEVTPNGDRVEAEVGQPITFVIDSDVSNELHVHSTPEHTLAFEPGETEETITIDRPGVAEVEIHDPEVVVVQLQVQ